MDDLAAKMELMCASMQGMNANIERLLAAPQTPAERPKRDPQKTARVSGAISVAAAVAVVEGAKALADAGTHAPAGM